eukprot:NODE_7387_length_1583_cov_7.894231.p1 GENE.NODE_7387_length_1583_cov_7.894231~~NODE_7387_length_1583_cov_7.894231.p1  ORF type:complete len:430 (+),score=87.87 NODE_7387_length_1583_cov_7.894231:40-1329(+)
MASHAADHESSAGSNMMPTVYVALSQRADGAQGCSGCVAGANEDVCDVDDAGDDLLLALEHALSEDVAAPPSRDSEAIAGDASGGCDAGDGGDASCGDSNALLQAQALSLADNGGHGSCTCPADDINKLEDPALSWLRSKRHATCNAAGATADAANHSTAVLMYASAMALSSSEIMLCIALFLPWREMLRCAWLDGAWCAFGADDAIWEACFRQLWPRLARRWDASSVAARAATRAGSSGDAGDAGDMAVRTNRSAAATWGALFRQRWAKAGSSLNEDALDEDWLDFTAVRERELSEAAVCSTELSLQQAARDMGYELYRLRGIRVPTEPDWSHVCTAHCRFHRLPVGRDAFVCEASGFVHQCDSERACDIAVLTPANFLVCPVSGRCVVKHSELADEGPPEPAWPDADADLSAGQQFAQWFEQGYLAA